MNEAVLDTSVLCCFARIERMDLLGRVLSAFEVVVTEDVLDEVRRRSAIEPVLHRAIGLPWIRVVQLQEPAELELFTRYYQRLDLGESTVLAYAKRRGVVALLDEKAGRQLAREEQIAVHGSIWVLAGAIRGGMLTMDQACEMIDVLRDAGTYLPCTGADFPAWAHLHGLLVADEATPSETRPRPL